jgi:hypothetical protein
MGMSLFYDWLAQPELKRQILGIPNFQGFISAAAGQVSRTGRKGQAIDGIIVGFNLWLDFLHLRIEPI